MGNLSVHLTAISPSYKTVLKLCLLILTGLAILSLSGCEGQLIGMLNPKGIVAYHERRLFFDTLALMLIVVLPVIVMSITFLYHYQVSHRIRDYKPNWGHSYFLESLWWGIPCLIILILAIITWKKTLELDPYRRVPGQYATPLQIQVVALPWKWLFVYPTENIATVNSLVIPVGQEIEFHFTTDNVPMSSFFIPQLGGQIYVMAGMSTRLHLVANEKGVFDGMNTQFNGVGFSDMHFPVYAVSPEKMQAWIKTVKKSPDYLNEETYKKLLNPSIGDKSRYFSGIKPDLFETVMDTYRMTYGIVHPRNDALKVFDEHPKLEGQ